MEVVNVSEGKHISYEVSGSKVTFRDEGMIDVSKYERDYAVTVDICIDSNDMVVVNGLGVKYAAQIEIPARAYVDKEINNPQYEEGGDQPERVTVPDPVPFDMGRVTLRLFAID